MLTKMMQEYYKKPVILLMDEYFGFTGNDVKRLLQSADLEKYGERIQSWYDGYHFGDVDVYCPWDVMNYVRDLQFDPDARPVSYWKNTSSNSIIRSFIDFAGNSITRKLETLMEGGYITRKLKKILPMIICILRRKICGAYFILPVILPRSGNQSRKLFRGKTEQR